MWMLAAFALALVAVGYWAFRQPARDRSPDGLAQTLGQGRDAHPAGEGVAPASPGGRPGRSKQAGDVVATGPQLTTTAPGPAPSAPPATTAAAPAPSAEPADGDVDRQRTAGAEAMDRALTALAARADQTDAAWQRLRAACPQTAASAPSGGDREWLAVAGAATQDWTASCPQAAPFLELLAQVRDGVCGAEESARRSWVLPGTRRELRARHRLEWSGWDGVCG